MHRHVTTLFITVLMTTSACVQISKHNPEMAAAAALEFAKSALIERDVDKAYNLLDPEVQSNAPKQRFAEILEKMNSAGWPNVITATDFEPTESDGMNIYLTGENGNEKIYFRIPVRGNDKKGYRPIGVLRGQYPPSDTRQPLQIKLSTEP